MTAEKSPALAATFFATGLAALQQADPIGDFVKEALRQGFTREDFEAVRAELLKSINMPLIQTVRNRFCDQANSFKGKPRLPFGGL
jgi:hypothetical protein